MCVVSGLVRSIRSDHFQRSIRPPGPRLAVDLCVTVGEDNLQPFGGIAARKPLINMGSAVTEVGSASEPTRI